MTGGGAFSNIDHIWNLSEEICNKKKYRDTAYETKLTGLVRNLKVTDKLQILCAKITGSWLSVRGTTALGTVLSATEFRNFFVLAITCLP